MSECDKYIIVGQPWGKNSAKVSIFGICYGNSREPHVNFKGIFPPNGTKFLVGPAYQKGKAIMRNLIGTKYHITVYYGIDAWEKINDYI
jgi:hypothetical protein